MKEGELYKKPDMYWNNAGNPQLKKVSTGAEFSNTILTIIDFIETRVTIDASGGFALIPINHNLGKVHDFFARYSTDNKETWIEIPTLFTIGASGSYTGVLVTHMSKNTMYVQFAIPPFQGDVDIEVYFIDFSI